MSMRNEIEERQRAMWRAEATAARRPSAQPAPIRNANATGRYEPVELAPFVRTGAMDAYALPSVVMGRRVWPRRAQQRGAGQA